MRLPKNIKTILNTKIKNFEERDKVHSWVVMLNFAEDNFDALTNREKRKFLDKSEEFRTFLNIERIIDVQIFKNGKYEMGKNNIPSLNINIDEMNYKIYKLDITENLLDKLLDNSLDKIKSLYYTFTIIFKKTRLT